jgi:hypothetical protein
MFQTKVVEKIKTHILCSIKFFRKSCRLWDNVEKYGTARQATDDNIIRRMRFECRITKATDTLTICNTYCFSTATMVTRTRPNVTFIRTLPVLLLSKPKASTPAMNTHPRRLGSDAVSTSNLAQRYLVLSRSLRGSVLNIFISFSGLKMIWNQLLCWAVVYHEYSTSDETVIHLVLYA